MAARRRSLDLTLPALGCLSWIVTIGFVAGVIALAHAGKW